MQSGDWTLPRLVIVASHALVWLASGFLLGFDYRAVAFSDPLMGALLAIGLVCTVWLALRDAPWLYLAAGLATALVPFVALFAFNALFAMGRPGLGAKYVGAVLLLLALGLTVPAAVQGHAAARGRRPPVPLRGASRSRQGLYALALTAVAVGMTWTGAFAGDAGLQPARTYDFDPADASVPSFNLTARDNAFEGPGKLQAGAITELVLQNEGELFHTFTYEHEGVEYSHDLPAGAEVTVLVHFASEGTIPFRCVPHSSGYDDADGMVGAITVARAA